MPPLLFFRYRGDLMKVFLDKVRLQNCQSMEDVTLEFVNGINIIAGDNSYGKSIFMKVLRLTVFPEEYNQSARNDIIRYGKDFAQVHYFFSDGMDCIVKIYRNKSIYMLHDANISQDYLTDVVPFGRLKNALSVIADDQEKFLVNVFNAGQELFLVKSDSRTNERLIRASCYDEELEQLKTLVTDKAQLYKDEESELKGILYNYMLSMGDQQYKDTTELERLLEISDVLIKSLTGLVEMNDLFDSLIPYENIGGLNIDDCMTLLTVHEVYNLLEQVQHVDEVQQSVLDAAYNVLPVLDDVEKLMEVDYAQESVLISLSGCLPILTGIGELQEDNYELLDSLHKVFEVLNLIDNIAEEVDYDLPVMLADVRSTLMKLNNLLNDYTANLSAWVSANDEAKRLNRKMKEYNGLVSCQIYGEVFFIDGKCVPADNRLT